VRRFILIAAAATLTVLAPALDSGAIQNSGGQVQVLITARILVSGAGTLDLGIEAPLADLSVLSDRISLSGPVTRSFAPATRSLVGDYTLLLNTPISKASARKASSKVPVIGDIPLLGYLFNSKTETERLTELLILITPEVIGDPGKKAVPSFDIGGSIEVTAAKMGGKVSIDSSYSRYAGKLSVKFSGTVLDGPHAGKTVKGQMKIGLSGNRTF
jgi:hypothetical protein